MVEKIFLLKLKMRKHWLINNEIWSKIKKTLTIKLHSQPIYDEKFIKSKVKTFDDVINIVFLDNEIPKQGIHYICIAPIKIDSVMKIDKKKYP